MHVEWKAAGRALLVLCRPFQKPAESAAISVTLSPLRSWARAQLTLCVLCRFCNYQRKRTVN
jgi:hypothetical protein